RIMCMEENDQRVMMECIQELDAVGGGALSFSASLSLVDPHVEALVAQLAAANAAKEKADQRIHQLTLQVNMLQEEKSAMYDENQKIMDQLNSRFEPGGGPLTRQDFLVHFIIFHRFRTPFAGGVVQRGSFAAEGGKFQIGNAPRRLSPQARNAGQGADRTSVQDRGTVEGRERSAIVKGRTGRAPGNS
ncbi:unnamed protein product, partial [Nesidiocoris tenuis]